MRFNTRFDRVTPFTKEVIVGPSETVPDDSLTIPQILSKYIRGQRIDTSFPGGFETDEDGDMPFEEEFNPKPAQAAAPAPSQEPEPAAAGEPASEPNSTN